MADGLVVPQPEQAAALYRAHGRALRAYVSTRISDPGLVDDICQETFVAAIDRGVPPEGVGGWLFGIARNKVLKHMRDWRPSVAQGSERTGSEALPAERLDREEARARVRRAVDALPEPLREVIQLRYEGGLHYRQIAEHLELPFATIQGRLKRAKVALRRSLVQEEGG